jgi:hypothetical protein
VLTVIPLETPNYIEKTDQYLSFGKWEGKGTYFSSQKPRTMIQRSLSSTISRLSRDVDLTSHRSDVYDASTRWHVGNCFLDHVDCAVVV